VQRSRLHMDMLMSGYGLFYLSLYLVFRSFSRIAPTS
jgi:hypothetical protein